MNAAAESAYLNELIAHKLLFPVGVPGVFGRGAVYEDVIGRFDAYITRMGEADKAEVIRFPPIQNRKHFETSEYLKSFPQLAGSVFSFTGNDQQHMKLLEAVHDGRDWKEYQTMTDVVLGPAACYPVYPLSTGTLAEGGKLYDVLAWCFRHEPSNDPARMQMFRMREYVRLADFETVKTWRDMWLERGKQMMKAVGLEGNAATATDPFFGRGGRMLAVNQREQELKFEILTPITSEENPTAIMSFNYHQDHFGSLFHIKTPAGQVAQTACAAFGMDRIALALFKTHGFVPAEWPAPVRQTLWG